MNTPADGLENQLHPPPLLPGQRVRVEKAVLVGPGHNHDGPGRDTLQIRTHREQGEIRCIEIVCSCGRTIRLRCVYES